MDIIIVSGDDALTNIDVKRAFLREAKQLISVGKKDFIKRTYNNPSREQIRWIEALGEIGLTDLSQVWDEILKLTPNDCIDGPIQDVGRPQDGDVIWVFKKDINDVQTYIKLRIDTGRGCVCLSFHKDW